MSHESSAIVLSGWPCVQCNWYSRYSATCYARSIEVANNIIFEAATDFMHILALAMTSIMILHVRSKFTAVGT